MSVNGEWESTGEEYRTDTFLRGEVNEGRGAGSLLGSKQPVPSVWVFPDGWDGGVLLLYPCFFGGALKKGSIELYYRGTVEWQGEKVFGDYLLTIKGDGEGFTDIAFQIAKHGKPVLDLGNYDKSLRPKEITSITLMELAVRVREDLPNI